MGTDGVFEKDFIGQEAGLFGKVKLGGFNFPSSKAFTVRIESLDPVYILE